MALIDCTECGYRISTRAAACPSCGSPMPSNRFVPHAVPAGRYESPARLAGSSGTSLWAMLCGVGGLVMLFLPFAWLLAGLPNVLGVVLGAVAMGKIRRGEAEGWGLAVTGLVTGLIGLLIYAGMWLLWQDAVHQAIGE